MTGVVARTKSAFVVTARPPNSVSAPSAKHVRTLACSVLRSRAFAWSESGKSTGQARIISSLRASSSPLSSASSIFLASGVELPHIRTSSSNDNDPADVRSGVALRCSATGASSTSSAASAVVGFASTVVQQAVSLALVFLLQTGVAKALHALGWVFPAPLATMLIMLSIITFFRVIRQSKLIDSVIGVCFSPAVAFLSKWLAVFFVPNLVMLPLAPALPSADLTKILFLVPLAFLTTLCLSAFLCCSLRSLSSSSSPKSINSASPMAPTSPPPTPKPPTGASLNASSNRLIATLFTVCLTTLGICFKTGSIINASAKLYALSATLLTFSAGQRMSKRMKLLIHPLVSCTLGTLGLIKLLSVLTGNTFVTTLSSYYLRAATTTAPTITAFSGAGNMLSALLGPAVVTFAFTIDKHRKLALSRLVEVICVSFVVACCSLLGTAFAARMIQLAVPSRLLLIPRTVTAPLAIPIAALIGADPGLAASVVAITGLIGANVGRILLNLIKVNDPVVRGLSLGSAAHGLGTAAMNEEPNALPFAALAMALVGIFSTILVAISPFRQLLLQIATVAASM